MIFFGVKLLSHVEGVILLSSDNPLNSHAKVLLIVPLNVLKYLKAG